MTNLLKKLSAEIQSKLKDFGVSFVGVDEFSELNVSSEYDMDASYYEAIENELKVKGFMGDIPTELELRNKLAEMDKAEFIALRNQLEGNWNESLRPLMQILSLGCIQKFKVKLSELNEDYYSQEIVKPTNMKEGALNFVQMIINNIEAGNTREALLKAVSFKNDIESDIYNIGLT